MEKRTTVDLSPREARAIFLMRRLGYGEVTFEVQNGEPVAARRVTADIRLDKPEYPGLAELLAAV